MDTIVTTPSLVEQLEAVATYLDDSSASRAQIVRESIASLRVVCADRDNRMAQITALREQTVARDNAHARFGDTVRAAIIGKADEMDDDVLDSLLAEIGLDPRKQQRVEFTVSITREFTVRARPTNTSSSGKAYEDDKFIHQSILDGRPDMFEMDDDWEDVETLDDGDDDHIVVKHVRTLDPSEDE